MSTAAASVRYRIVPKNPRAHLFEVTTEIDRPVAGQRVSMPAWIPGSYLIREFARHVVTLTAHDKRGAVVVDKIDKHTWELAGGARDQVTLVATVYAWDLSVRAAHLDQLHGFFNGSSVFFSVAGREHEPCDVVIEPPDDPTCKGWRVATTLPAVDVRPPGFGRYRAPDYDTLVDHPVEMGTFETVEWTSGGVPHSMALTGRVRLDKERLASDLRAVCDEHIRMFGAAPMQRYLFLTTALGDGYGGLEHKDSTALICKRDDLPLPASSTTATTTAGAAKPPKPSEGYRGFLGLCSHEYFHLWNVKRIKPAAFTPYRLHEENYTRLLWAFEGITSYYDDLALVRAGVIDVESWLDLLGKTVTRVLKGKGREKQSVSDSSFDAWIKFYRPDENTSNAVVSYYTKGSLVALALDVTMRQASNDKKSLDDVMRALWQRHGQTGVGVPEDGVERIASELVGVDLTPFFDEYVRGTADVPLGGLLESYGIRMHLRAGETDGDAGGKASSKGSDDLQGRGSLGVGTGGGGDDGARIAMVHDGSAAQEAGLSAGDVVIAVDGLRATRGNLHRLCGQHPPGARVHLHVFRRDELLELDVTLKAPEQNVCWFSLADDAPKEAIARRQAWLAPSP